MEGNHWQLRSATEHYSQRGNPEEHDFQEDTAEGPMAL